MSFISNLFKKKPGGTAIGNLFRKAANTATGGILGNGANMITQQEYDKKNITDAEYEMKYGLTKTGQYVNNQPPNEQQKKAADATAKLSPGEWFKKYWYIALGGIVGFVLLVWGIIKLSKKSGRRRGGY